MPIAPILMTPAYRWGAATPWGGEALRTMFRKQIPGEHTGEALEVSAIPGLESRDPSGNTLTELIEQYGERLTGKGFAHPFPLLLKLLDAKDTLSVQVHPDDAYAACVEGKLGKTEAWHILFAAPGAELVYGVKAGTEKDALLNASRNGAEVENLLRRVKVRAGETYYIPAGMVHAIGAGIVLYEIQQSSDVTYRFYDWERRDKEGRKRELAVSGCWTNSISAWTVFRILKASCSPIPAGLPSLRPFGNAACAGRGDLPTACACPPDIPPCCPPTDTISPCPHPGLF